MKVTRLRTERGEWNGVGKLEEASGGSQRRIGRKDQKSVFGGVVKIMQQRKRERERWGSDRQ